VLQHAGKILVFLKTNLITAIKNQELNIVALAIRSNIALSK